VTSDLLQRIAAEARVDSSSPGEALNVYASPRAVINGHAGGRSAPESEPAPGTELAAATYAILDVETTGFDPGNDRVVEVACLIMRGDAIISSFQSLVDPGLPIPAEASAIHGIFDRDVRDAPPFGHIERHLRSLVRDSVVVAHNARFDVSFLPFLAERPVICTMRLAMHLVDSTSYKNRALCELLGTETVPGPLRVHRAAADARLTAGVFRELLRRYSALPAPQTIAGLIERIARPARLARFAFGKHRGDAIEHVPTDYLRGILAAGIEDWPDVRYTAERELAARELPTSYD
jgi:DNA polymerase III epsilon subunit-like protein